MKKSIARNLPAQLINSIGSQIVSGAILPGTVLTADALAEEYGVSRTVVREALKVLHDKGLTRARTKTGTLVLERYEWNLLDPDLLGWLHGSGLGADLMRDLEEVRESYEPWVARVAAIRRGSKDVAALTSSFKRMELAFKTEGYSSDVVTVEDLNFHEAMLDATQNELMKQIGRLFTPLLRIRDDLVHTVITDDRFIQDHQDVLDAIVDEDPDAAEIAMKKLLATSSKNSKEAIKLKKRK